MKTEYISKVEISEDGELSVTLRSGGDKSYEMIYREAKGVYWDNSIKSFRVRAVGNFSLTERINHIFSVTEGVGISLKLSKNTSWLNIPQLVKAAICDT